MTSLRRIIQAGIAPIGAPAGVAAMIEDGQAEPAAEDATLPPPAVDATEKEGWLIKKNQRYDSAVR